MKKAVSFLRSYIGHAGAYFMFTMLVFGLVYYATAKEDFMLVLVWSSLLFGLLVACCDLLFVFPLIRSYVANVVIHGVLTVASFAVSFVWASGAIERGKTAVFGILFFSVLYVILAVIRCVYHFAMTRKENEKKEYKNLYIPNDID